jgi:hypothetical protein
VATLKSRALNRLISSCSKRVTVVGIRTNVRHGGGIGAAKGASGVPKPFRPRTTPSDLRRRCSRKNVTWRNTASSRARFWALISRYVVFSQARNSVAGLGLRMILEESRVRQARATSSRLRD